MIVLSFVPMIFGVFTCRYSRPDLVSVGSVSLFDRLTAKIVSPLLEIVSV